MEEEEGEGGGGIKSCSLDLSLLGVISEATVSAVNVGVGGMVTINEVVFRLVQFFSLLLLGGTMRASMIGWSVFILPMSGGDWGGRGRGDCGG